MTRADHARPLGFGPLLALGVNGIVGVGIFFVPAQVAAQVPGTPGVVVYLVTAFALLPIAAGYAALGSRFDVDGGPFVWASAAFGARVGFLVGWVTFVSSLFSLAAVLSGLAEHVAPVLGVEGAGGVRAISMACTLALAAVASTGLRPSSVVWSTVTILKLLPLLVLVALGVASASAVPAGAGAHAAQAGGASAMARAALVVVFAFQGFEIVPLLAGSVRRSSSSVPLATVLSLLTATALYAALHVFVARAVPDLASSRAPLPEAARVYGGEVARTIVAAGANVSALGIAFGMLNTTPRYLSTLSTPESFGSFIGKTDVRAVPQRALWITVGATLAMETLSDQLTELFVLSSLAVLAQYGVVLASLGALALARRHGLSRRHLWPVPLSGVAMVALTAKAASARELATTLGVVALGIGLRRGLRGPHGPA